MADHLPQLMEGTRVEKLLQKEREGREWERATLARLLCELGYAHDPRIDGMTPIPVVPSDLNVQAFVGEARDLTPDEVNTVIEEYRQVGRSWET